MALLPIYASLNEKLEFFHQGDQTIETKRDFDRLWDRLHTFDEKRTYCFRGCNSARFKMFTSAQRFWLEQELNRQGISYHDFIKKLIDQTISWNERTIMRFFTHYGIENNVLAYLSFMQHYGVPTPLLDFTTDPFTGLYFAVQNPAFTSAHQPIDSYCSLYIMDISNPYFADISGQFNKDIAASPDKPIEYDKHLLTYSVLFVSGENAAYKISNSLNISNQRGIFFFNSDPDRPLEEVYCELMVPLKRDLGTSLFEQNKYRDKFAECVNLHKNLRPYALSKLHSKAVSREFIFPDLEKFRESTLLRTLTEL